MVHPICQRPPWSSPPSCPYRPRSRRPPTQIALKLSDMLKVKKTFMSTTTTAAIHILVEENYNWSSTSSCQRPPLSSPSCRPCCPQWRRPPNNMRNYKTIKTWLDSPTAVWVLSFFFISLIHVFFDRGGKVVSFEMGPPFQMLDINKRYFIISLIFKSS